MRQRLSRDILNGGCPSRNIGIIAVAPPQYPPAWHKYTIFAGCFARKVVQAARVASKSCSRARTPLRLPHWVCCTAALETPQLNQGAGEQRGIEIKIFHITRTYRNQNKQCSEGDQNKTGISKNKKRRS